MREEEEGVGRRDGVMKEVEEERRGREGGGKVRQCHMLTGVMWSLEKCTALLSCCSVSQ